MVDEWVIHTNFAQGTSVYGRVTHSQLAHGGECEYEEYAMDQLQQLRPTGKLATFCSQPNTRIERAAVYSPNSNAKAEKQVFKFSGVLSDGVLDPSAWGIPRPKTTADQPPKELLLMKTSPVLQLEG